MKKISNLNIVFILLLVSNTCFAQTENINTDRPDQSDGVYTIPQNKFQLENGITLSKETFLNNFMLRYGLTHSTEIRLLSDAGKEAGVSGLKPTTLSAKQRIIQQHNILPAITFVGYVSFGKLASKDFQDKQNPFELKLAFENELNDQFAISYNVGTSDEFKALNLTLNFGFAPSEKISTFVEYYSTIKRLDAGHNIDAGILYILNPQLQFDIACGGGFAGYGDDFFTTFGVSYFFK